MVTGGVVVRGVTFGALTVRITVFVSHVAVLQFGVFTLVKTAKLDNTCPVESVRFTVTWKVTVRAFAVPAAMFSPAQVTVPPLSDAVHPGAPPQLADVATYVVPLGTPSVTVTPEASA